MNDRPDFEIKVSSAIELIQRLQVVKDFGELKATYVECLSDMGVRMMSYHHLPPIGAPDYTPHLTVVAHGFPEDWVRRYVDEELYLIDPIPPNAARVLLPFKWSDAWHFSDLTEDNKRYLEMMKDAELGDGLAIPVYGPHGREGYAGYGFGQPELSLDAVQIALFRWAAQLGHLYYCDLLLSVPDRDVQLSPREREVLQWTAYGKSNAVIAEILGMSPHTVDTYMRRIFEKLHVADRVTASLRALSLGLI
ncbi:MAG: LuxR family transcriptional regulator [Woeseiaceae bacterium]|nr:LuxR family transcriptional regulator [Woeseiaceae bacterium]